MPRDEDLTPHPGFRKSAEFWWDVLDRIFEFPEPRVFPPFGSAMSAEDRAAIERYLLQTVRLTTSSGLNGATGLRMSFTRESGLVSDANFPSHEAMSALATLFRQVDSPEERASFASVMRILQRLARDGTAEEGARVDALAVWGKAARALHGKRAERLAMEKMGYPWPDDDSTPAPEKLISTYLHGEHVHWDADKAGQIEAWSAVPFVEDLHRYRFYEAVAPLANLYVMFGVFVKHILRASDETLAA